MKPIIGINVDMEQGPPRQAVVQQTYIEAITRAGGVPLLIPPMPDEDLLVLLKQINGIMLIGGRDYNPTLYGETACEKVALTEASREDFDMRLVRRTLHDTELPLLGICAGCQALNIALGGSLVQDIPSEFPHSAVEHSSKNGWINGFNKHAVRIEKSSRLGKLYRELQLDVPTSHHQSVRGLGQGLQATAYADDDIIEAVELPSKPFVIGVQWHPERDYESNQGLFEEFVKQAARVAVPAK